MEAGVMAFAEQQACSWEGEPLYAYRSDPGGLRCLGYCAFWLFVGTEAAGLDAHRQSGASCV